MWWHWGGKWEKAVSILSQAKPRYSTEAILKTYDLFINGYMHYIFTYLITALSRVLLEKLTSSQLVKKFPAVYGTRSFITAFTSARQLPLYWASSIQSVVPHPTYWRSILILFCVFQVVSFPHISPPKPCIASPLPQRATCPAHFILLVLNTRTIQCVYLL